MGTQRRSVWQLFQDKKYLLQLYKALHPEDTDVTEDDLTDITNKYVLTDNIYNDLGFTVGDKLMILMEAQSSVWTVNIIVRALIYLVQTWHDYFERTKQNLYKSKKVQMPMPEIYVIFTGERRTKPPEISLSQEFFDGKEGDIINKYVIFTKVCNEQMKKYGRTRKAVMEAIRICNNRNVLGEYLGSKESEVVDIMMVLYDEEEIMQENWQIRAALSTIHGGFLLITDHFISEITDFPQQPGTQRQTPDGSRRHAKPNRTGGKVFVPRLSFPRINRGFSGISSPAGQKQKEIDKNVTTEDTR